MAIDWKNVPHRYDGETGVPLASWCRLCKGRVDDILHDPALVARSGPDGIECPTHMVDVPWGTPERFRCALHGVDVKRGDRVCSARPVR